MWGEPAGACPYRSLLSKGPATAGEEAGGESAISPPKLRRRSRLPLYNAEAIIIRVRDFDEADKIITLLTREEGKVSAVAKGARRPRSRFAAATQLFTHCDVALFSGKRMDTLSQIEIRAAYRPLREDLVRMAYATYLCELVDETVQEKQRMESVFLLLLATLHLISAAEIDPEPVSRAFELKLMSLLGFRPVLAECVSCGRSLDQVAAPMLRFSPGLGGVLCDRCPGEEGPAVWLSRGTLETMRHLLDGDLRRAHLWKMSPDIRRELGRALEQFIAFRVEKRLRSLDFLSSVRNL